MPDFGGSGRGVRCVTRFWHTDIGASFAETYQAHRAKTTRVTRVDDLVDVTGLPATPPAARDRSSLRCSPENLTHFTGAGL